MAEYKVLLNFQGYIRGTSVVTIEANSEEEALKNANSIDESVINIIRDDTEITDKEIL